ncbi:pentatricopeptide repeat-containing protein At1g59720, chloroplastic/mitochondrial [Populus alba]|uniref:Pentatricopeptide repeat-containing protein n=1 Tax=Populus alba TaxID=43335 RepID=A0A4U5QJ51_POPAL|nr:pentatricopeptide repeat-containing protein At1g59720, chloroplastic/mitochondrial [Populus alba]TKS10672.1 pentatricopeptide repeat-containing protein [Populus alba]
MVLGVIQSPPPQIVTSKPASHCNLLLQHLNECKDMSQLKQIHALSLRSTLPNHPTTLFLYSRILHFSSLHDLNYAFRVFDHIDNPNSFMWNILIRACAQSQSVHLKREAILLYNTMLQRSSPFPDNHTFPFVLKACAYLFALFEGKQAHAHLLKLGFQSDVYINNSLIHFYASCGSLESAKNVFDKMPQRSLVSWNAMIDAFVLFGEFETALQLFVQFQQQFFEPDGYTIQSVINACAGLCALSLGMWAHAFLLRNCGVSVARDHVLVNNSLLDMYCKCGSLDIATQIFEGMQKHDVTSWNSMILGFAMHGKGELALECFERMIRISRFVPNSITFVGVLSACNHRYMVNEGRKYFDMMVNEYKIEPQLEHYGCLVDILARAGLIDEALELVSSMPMKPDVVIWRSLLDSCCKRNASVELSENIARQILESEQGDSSGVYVLLSRVYASASRWNDVGLVRKLMTNNGILKEPGCSLIEVDGVTHEFFAGDTSHPQTKEIYQVLNVVEERLDSTGYKPDYSQAPMVDELNTSKRDSLRLHSERLAIAFGLLNLKPGMPIRIFKNLRVCDDCHKVTGLISEIFNVEIIVRDRVRFHHFKDGSCSCMDYW